MTIENFNVLDIPLNPVTVIGPTMVGPGKNFQNRNSKPAGKRYFEFDFCN